MSNKQLYIYLFMLIAGVITFAMIFGKGSRGNFGHFFEGFGNDDGIEHAGHAKPPKKPQ